MKITNYTITFEVFHFDISGNENNSLLLENISPILVTLEVSNFDMSGNEDNDYI